MSQSKLVFLPTQIEVLGSSATDISTGNNVVSLLASGVATLQLRFSLPRSILAGLGYTINSFAVSYTLTSGTLTSATPTLARIQYEDAVATSSTSVPLNAASPAFNLGPGPVNSTALVAVTTPAIDNQTNARSISYLFNVALVATSAAAVSLSLKGMEVNYSQVPNNRSAETISASVGTPVALTAAQVLTGVITSDASGGAATLTLPSVQGANGLVQVAAGQSGPVSVGQVFKFLLVNGNTNTTTIAIPGASGWTNSIGTAPAALAANTSRLWYIRVTSVAAGVETATLI